MTKYYFIRYEFDCEVNLYDWRYVINDYEKYNKQPVKQSNKLHYEICEMVNSSCNTHYNLKSTEGESPIFATLENFKILENIPLEKDFNNMIFRRIWGNVLILNPNKPLFDLEQLKKYLFNQYDDILYGVDRIDESYEKTEEFKNRLPNKINSERDYLKFANALYIKKIKEENPEEYAEYSLDKYDPTFLMSGDNPVFYNEPVVYMSHDLSYILPIFKYCNDLYKLYKSTIYDHTWYYVEGLHMFIKKSPISCKEINGEYLLKAWQW